MNDIFSATDETINIRLDRAIQMNCPDLTRASIQNLIENQKVSVNGKFEKKSYKLRVNDKINIEYSEPVESEILPQKIPLDIVYEDEYLLVVNKPKGMVVHPAVGNRDNTLVNALLHHCGDNLSGINGVKRPGIVHRIDKDTSGLLMVAKCDKAHNSLANQIKEHTFKRQYEALVWGNIKQDNGEIDAPIGRHPKDRKKMAVTDKNSKEAKTLYKVIGRYNGFTHLRLTLTTGRTHQIRVHLSYIGHPVVGDKVYSKQTKFTEYDGQILHAKVLGFVHPITGEYMEFESELPEYFKNILEKFKKL